MEDSSKRSRSPVDPLESNKRLNWDVKTLQQTAETIFSRAASDGTQLEALKNPREVYRPFFEQLTLELIGRNDLPMIPSVYAVHFKHAWTDTEPEQRSESIGHIVEY
ncbi:hypothetical protein H0H92_004308, partial [Tricholoma furcatifolium]